MNWKKPLASETLSLIFAVGIVIGGQQFVAWQINREMLVNRAVGYEIEQRLNMVFENSSVNRQMILELRARSHDRWTKTEHDKWVEELKRLNPDLKLPKIPDK